MVDFTPQNSLLHPLSRENPISMEHPTSIEQHIPIGNPTSSSNPLEKIQAYKKRRKIPIKDIQLPPQIVQLQREIETLQHQVLDLKGCLAMLEADKRTWEREK